MFLLVGTDLGDDIAFKGAQFFARSSMRRPVSAASMADEHSLDEQRSYNILCWMYGADAKGHEVLIQSGLLPEARAPHCPGEFASFALALREKLVPHQRT